MTIAKRFGAVCLLVLGLAGCAWWQEHGKPLARGLLDVARVWCAAAMQEPGAMDRAVSANPEIAGLTAEDVCEREEYVRPWLDQLTAMHAGVMQSAGLSEPNITAGAESPAAEVPGASPAAEAAPATEPTPDAGTVDGGSP